MKICSKCKIEKSFKDFSKRSAAKDGRQSCCAACHKALMKKQYYDKDAYYKGKARAYRQTIMREVREAKNKPCMDCGGVFHFSAMDFDHLSDKKFNLSQAWKTGLLLAKAEISKCDVVCSNCHRVRTWKRLQKTGPEAQLDEQLPTKE